MQPRVLKWLFTQLLASLRADRGKPEFHRDRARRYLDAGQWREAAASSRAALELDPADPQDWNCLGLAYKELGELAQAQECFDRALTLAPGSLGALCNAASARRDLGSIEESIALFRRARALAPDNLDVLSAYLFTLNLSAHAGREEVFREHMECERLLGALGRDRPRAQRPERARLRVGYFSPDLRYHAVAQFVEPLLRHHDREQFEVLCYYLHPRHDAVSHHLRQLSEHWVDCAGWADAEIAARIESDGVDILVDLAGHTDWGRIPVLARKPAPVIATWLGYLNTTGLRAVDYRITDRHTDPPGLTERFHSETLIRLPESQWCRRGYDSQIAVSPLPAASSGAPRFGSFNKSSKLTREALALWSGILLRIPGSSLLLAGVEESRRDGIRDIFASHGVEPARLAFAGRLPLEQFLGLHRDVDIALDPYPYSGATTTFDSLWMGVPVLTLAGAAPVSRSTASILSTLGMDDWIAHSDAQYSQLAADHAAQTGALAELRAGLRNRLERSILMDGAGFTRQLEELYRQMWRARAPATG